MLCSFSPWVRPCAQYYITCRRLYQLQAVSAELLEKFEFSLPEDKPCILRGPGVGMVALVEEKSGEQIAAMPLRVTLAQ